MSNVINVIDRRIQRIKSDIIRYKNYIKIDLESDDISKIESSLKSYSDDILILVRTIEELEDIKKRLQEG